MFNEFEPGALLRAASEATQLAQIPQYLSETYWWAYIHPRAIRVFDRMMAVNFILFGNYRRLRNAVLAALPPKLTGKTLQVACVYGDFTPVLASRLAPDASLDVVDVVPIQLKNLRHKLPAEAPVKLYLRDSTALEFETGKYDQVIVFFLLHEQPEEVRRQTLAEVARVVKPGGRVVVIDYHRPHGLNPLRVLMKPLLSRLEPFALDLWRCELSRWFPEELAGRNIDKTTYFGGLYQRLVIET